MKRLLKALLKRCQRVDLLKAYLKIKEELEPFETIKMPELLSKKQVAIMLGISESEVTIYINAGKLPFIKVGRFTRFKREDIERYLLSKTSTYMHVPEAEYKGAV